ncbi:hypothetical protein EDC01DRAFT_673887 [Geopyxis carbonaria]|nr:hypothetical protein EDC01DRAFT_673887 [Geopyxis carbonaria]
MEPVDVALGAYDLIKPLCTYIDNYQLAHRTFGEDHVQLRVRFSTQVIQFEAFHRVLFYPDKFAPAVTGRLIDKFPVQISHDVVDLLRELYYMLLEYTAVHSRYALWPGDDQEPDTDAAGGHDIEALLLAGNKADAKQHSAASWHRRLIRDKRNLENLVDDFEAWTARTKHVLEVLWGPTPFFETISKMHVLEADADADTVGLTVGLSIRKLLALETKLDVYGSPRVSLAELPLAYATSYNGFQRAGKFREGLIEHKAYRGSDGRWRIPSRYGIYRRFIEQRTWQLAAMLHDANTVPRLRTCQCSAYMHFTNYSNFFLFKLSYPRPCDLPVRLTELMNILDFRPALEKRMQLAHRLAAAVAALHGFSWLHRGLCSNNVVFFPERVKSSAGEVKVESANPGDAAEEGRPYNPRREIRPNDPGLDMRLDDPRLVGFEIAVPESEPDYREELGSRSETCDDLYRHPAHWGRPSERFTRVHDIYGVFPLFHSDTVLPPFSVPRLVS